MIVVLAISFVLLLVLLLRSCQRKDNPPTEQHDSNTQQSQAQPSEPSQTESPHQPPQAETSGVSTAEETKPADINSNSFSGTTVSASGEEPTPTGDDASSATPAAFKQRPAGTPISPTQEISVQLIDAAQNKSKSVVADLQLTNDDIPADPYYATLVYTLATTRIFIAACQGRGGADPAFLKRMQIELDELEKIDRDDRYLQGHISQGIRLLGEVLHQFAELLDASGAQKESIAIGLEKIRSQPDENWQKLVTYTQGTIILARSAMSSLAKCPTNNQELPMLTGRVTTDFTQAIKTLVTVFEDRLSCIQPAKHQLESITRQKDRAAQKTTQIFPLAAIYMRSVYEMTSLLFDSL